MAPVPWESAMPALLPELFAFVMLTASSPIAGPPAPRPQSLPSYNPASATELRSVRREIDKGRDRGELSKKQARQLRREAGEIAMLERRYAAGGLSDAERAELRNRAEVLRALTRGKKLGALP